ncbi:MAG: hypothetical protein GEV04_25595, partial [Actinophytocola sp.]|nr:hypothetical protein [Actinophytocola sp.]
MRIAVATSASQNHPGARRYRSIAPRRAAPRRSGNAKIAPNVNLRHENALFDFAASPFYISKAAHDWTPVPGHKRRA